MISSVMPTYARYDLTIEKGEGVYVFSTKGRRYLDFGAGIAVSALGHCHPHLVSSLKKQTESLWHTSNLYHIPGQEYLDAFLLIYGEIEQNLSKKYNHLFSLYFLKFSCNFIFLVRKLLKIRLRISQKAFCA